MLFKHHINTNKIFHDHNSSGTLQFLSTLHPVNFLHINPYRTNVENRVSS